MPLLTLQAQVRAYVGESSQSALSDWKARGGTATQTPGRTDYEITRQKTYYADSLRDAANQALDEFITDALDSNLPLPKDELTLEVTNSAASKAND